MCAALFAYASRKSQAHRALGDCVGPGLSEDRRACHVGDGVRERGDSPRGPASC